MNQPPAFLRAARGFGIAGFVFGTIHAVWEFSTRTFVLDFQAGAGSSWLEKGQAIAQSAAIEGLGFLAIGLALGMLAASLAHGIPSSASVDQSFCSWFAIVVTAFFAWTSVTWAANDALPFLTKPAVLLLDAVGIGGALLAIVVFVQIARRMPSAPQGALVANTIAALLTGGTAAYIGMNIVLGASGGYRSPRRVGLALLCVVVALLAAAPIARRLIAPIARLGARLQTHPLVPTSVSRTLLVALCACILVSASSFRLSALTHDVAYSTIDPAGDRPVPREGTPNVLFVTIDTLRADHLSTYGYERETSPFLDSLAAEGVRFDDPVSAAAWTKPATGTIFTGLYPSRHGALYHGSRLQLPDGMQTVAEAFRENGYVTAGFVSNPNVKAVFDFDRGFDEFFDSPVEDTLTLACIRTTWFGRIVMRLLRHQFNWKYENDARQMNAHVFGWLAQNAQQRFFLYVHYIDPHIPYDPPSPWREEFAQDHGFPIFNARKERVGRDLYDAEIAYTDVAIRELADELKRLGVWDETLLVLTSDHGEEFFEHEVIGHGFSLFQPVVKVPLIMRGPGVPPGHSVAAPVQIVDLPATVLDVAGIGDGSFGDGRSFAAALHTDDWAADYEYFLENEFGPDDSNQRAFVFTGIRKGRWKLVLTEQNAYFPPQNEANDSEALYDLAADPNETNNVIHMPEHRALVEQLLGKLREHAEFLYATGFRDVEPAAISPEIRANLEALGY